MPKRNPFLHSNENQPITPRRSPRLLQHNHNATSEPHHPTNPQTPNPHNSKSTKFKDSAKNSSNKKSAESRSKSRNCVVGLRRSPRLNNGVVGFPSRSDHKVSVNDQNDKEPSKSGNFSGDSENSTPGSRKPARVKGRNQVVACEPKTKEYSVEHCVVAHEGFAVEGKARNGVKRKRKRQRKSCGEEIENGWTKEQELALRRAYLAAKPSPHFWKKVSKLVPGKSQQDCFDRVHRDHITPPQLQPRSRAKTINSSPLQQFSISASKLLKPIDKKVKRSNFLKPKNYITQKSVEKLLQHHLKGDQDREGDIFSVLEPNIDFSTNAFQPSEALSTPKQLKENQGSLQGCTETSSSSHKKSLSRGSDSCISDIVSPPVLKKVKNSVMHEKYINQLRCREARRRAASARIQMPITGNIIGEGSSIQKKDAVKAAKVALVSEARDAIIKFQQSQVNFMGNTCSSDEDIDDDIGVEYESP